MSTKRNDHKRAEAKPVNESGNETRKWIEERYGPITIEPGFVASVPTYDGPDATGLGATEEEAIAALYADITQGLDVVENKIEVSK